MTRLKPNARSVEASSLEGVSVEQLAGGLEAPEEAVAMRDGPASGLKLIDTILARGDLADYHLAHSARAELCLRVGKTAEARASYRRALDLTRQEPERRLLERRLGGLPN